MSAHGTAQAFIGKPTRLAMQRGFLPTAQGGKDSRDTGLHGGYGARGGEHDLDGMSTLDPTTHALNRALLEPVLSLFDMGQSARVGFASKGPLLEAAQTVSNDGQQHFMGQAVHADFGNRPVLKKDHLIWAQFLTNFPALICGEVNARDKVSMVCPARTRLIRYGNVQRVVGWIYLVVINRPHALPFNAAKNPGRLTGLTLKRNPKGPTDGRHDGDESDVAVHGSPLRDSKAEDHREQARTGTGYEHREGEEDVFHGSGNGNTACAVLADEYLPLARKSLQVILGSVSRLPSKMRGNVFARRREAVQCGKRLDEVENLALALGEFYCVHSRLLRRLGHFGWRDQFRPKQPDRLKARIARLTVSNLQEGCVWRASSFR